MDDLTLRYYEAEMRYRADVSPKLNKWSQLMPKSFNTHIDAEIVCEEEKKPGSAQVEPDSLTAEVLSSVFDIADITIVNQAVGKSFSD
ncbi:type VI secretion system baseplate subunit TssF [Enterobacteriaceae bacterium]